MGRSAIRPGCCHVAVNPPPGNAWDCFWRASRHSRRYSKDGNAEARALLQRFIELDPNFAWPYAGLALIHHEDVLNQWTESPSQSVLQAGEAVRKAIELANDDPFVQYARANVHRLTGQLDRAVDAFRRVVRLDPSYGFAFYQLGLVLACTGEPDRAIDHIETAMRLSPKDPWFNAFFFGMAMAHAAAGRYEEAVRAAQQSIQLNSGFPPVYLTLAASYVGLGRLQEARSTVRELLRLHPGFSLTGVKAIMTGWDSEFAERSIDALRMAGLPEQSVTQREPVLVTALTTVFTANDKIANAEQKFVKDVEKKCALLQDPASAFAGACAHPDLGVVGDCVIKAAGCQACLEINAFDDLDDGLESSAEVSNRPHLR